MYRCLESEQEQKGHHQTEESHSLRQSKSQNGIGKELLLEGRVAGVSNDEGTKDRADTSSGSGDSNGGSSGTNELGSGVNVFPDRGSGQGSAGLLTEIVHF